MKCLFVIIMILLYENSLIIKSKGKIGAHNSLLRTPIF